MTSDCNFISAMTCSPAVHSRDQSFPIFIPKACSTSGSLGVAAVTPENCNMR
jgi:hypothetical protein